MLLSPAMGAVLMSASTVILAINARILKVKSSDTVITKENAATHDSSGHS
jgi:hypothetical protein